MISIETSDRIRCRATARGSNKELILDGLRVIDALANIINPEEKRGDKRFQTGVASSLRIWATYLDKLAAEQERQLPEDVNVMAMREHADELVRGMTVIRVPHKGGDGQ